MKMRPVEAELFNGDRQTWRSCSRFPQFYEGAYEQMATWQLESFTFRLRASYWVHSKNWNTLFEERIVRHRRWGGV